MKTVELNDVALRFVFLYTEGFLNDCIQYEVERVVFKKVCVDVIEKSKGKVESVDVFALFSLLSSLLPL